MDMRQLQYFITICDVGSFSKASELCYISQQALSTSIMRLEDELDVKLFDRTSKGATPTKAGLIFRQKAEEILKIEKETKQHLGNLRKVSPNLTIGCAYGVIGVLADKLLNIRELNNRGIQLKIIEYTDIDCDKAVASGAVDIGFAISPIDDNLFNSIPIIKKKCYFIVPHSHPLAKYKTVSADMLMDDNIIMINDKFKVNHIFKAICDKKGIIPQFAYETGEIAPISTLVERNFGVGASIDFVASKLDKRKFAVLELDDKDFIWNVCLITKKGIKNDLLKTSFINYITE